MLAQLAGHCAEGALIYSCMDWRHSYELQTAGRETALKLLNLCVWNKDNGGMGSFYRSKHELVFVFKKGSSPHINNIELGQYGRYRTNVWDYAGANTLRQGRLADLAMHPTVKPVALVADAIKDCTGAAISCWMPSRAAGRRSWRRTGPGGVGVRSSSTRATSTLRSADGSG